MYFWGGIHMLLFNVFLVAKLFYNLLCMSASQSIKYDFLGSYWRFLWCKFVSILYNFCLSVGHDFKCDFWQVSWFPLTFCLFSLFYLLWQLNSCSITHFVRLSIPLFLCFASYGCCHPYVYHLLVAFTLFYPPGSYSSNS